MEQITKQELQKFLQEIQDKANSYLNNFLLKLDFNPDAFSHLSKIPIMVKPLKDEWSKYDADKNIIFLDEFNMNAIIINIKTNPHIKEKAINKLAIDVIHEIIHANRTLFIENGYNPNTSDEIIKYEKEQFHNSLENNKNQNDNILKTKQEYTYLASGYYHPYNDFQKLVDSNKIHDNLNKKIKELPQDILEKITVEDKKNWLNKHFQTELNKQQTIAYNYTLLQHSFEESLTEAISQIILLCNNDETLDLYSITKKIEDNDNISLDVKIAAKFIRYAGIDILKWYMISTYEDVYNDQLSKIFEEKYFKLLLAFYKLYNSTIKESIPDINDIKTANTIIEEKVGKKM